MMWNPVAHDTVQMWQSELSSHRVPGFRETRVHTTILCQVMRSAEYRRDLKVLHYVYSKRFRAVNKTRSCPVSNDVHRHNNWLSAAAESIRQSNNVLKHDEGYSSWEKSRFLIIKLVITGVVCSYV
jgi:hypothetical protein